MSGTLVSVVDGKNVAEAGGATYRSTNPSRVADVVAEVSLATADTFVAACRAAARRAAGVGAMCRRRCAAG